MQGVIGTDLRMMEWLQELQAGGPAINKTLDVVTQRDTTLAYAEKLQTALHWMTKWAVFRKKEVLFCHTKLRDARNNGGVVPKEATEKAFAKFENGPDLKVSPAPGVAHLMAQCFAALEPGSKFGVLCKTMEDMDLSPEAIFSRVRQGNPTLQYGK
jgi:hypothetical protein